MIKYGLISETDARCLEKTIDFICNEFKEDVIHVTELGLYNCETSNGLADYLAKSKERFFFYTGIDNEKDKAIIAPDWMYLIIGNSNEVYNQLEDNSQHFIFIDGDHSLIGVISDFFAYADKVKKGGYIGFHDCGQHIKPFKDFQHGDKNTPDAYISVRRALKKIGLRLDNPEDQKEEVETMYRTSYWYDGTHGDDSPKYNWQLIFDEADINDEAGGICVFKKLY